MELTNLGHETEHIEFKKSIAEMKEAIISIVSILNKHGQGELYFGVRDDGTVLGQDIGKDTQRDVSRAIGYHIKPRLYPEISVKELGERKVVYVRFQGERQPYLAYNIPYIRVSDEDLVMDQDVYDDMLRSRDDKRKSWESRVSPYTIEDIDEDSLKKYLRKAREVGRIDFETDDPATVMKKLGLVEGDHLLNAGAALFCNTDINELQMARFASNERITFTDIRRYTGSIIELADKAEKYVIDAMYWRAEITGLTRIEIPEVPVTAVREAIINSFSHRIIEARQSNEIAIFKNRIEIYNYGTFPENIEPEQFIGGDQAPIRRNPLITSTLYYSKDMENFATGLKRISEACQEAGCALKFEKMAYGFRVVFYRVGYDGNGLPIKTYVDEDNASKVRESTGKVRESASKVRESTDEVRESASKVRENAGEVRESADKVQEGACDDCIQIQNADNKDEFTLSEQQRQIYAYIQQNGEITATIAEELLQVKHRRANMIIREMVKLGVIKRVGVSRATKYTL